MKNLSLTLFSAISLVMMMSCNDVQRTPGTIYMPDMTYSRAYETYIERDTTVFTQDVDKADAKIYYASRPVVGTIMRGEDVSFLLPKDPAGDSTNYVASKAIENPYTSLDANQMKEAERLFLINCAICHGSKLDGNGPLWKGGNGPFPAKPATLVGDAKYEAMPAGQMFYSIAYGKNLMGSYASQLNRQQRWMVIAYIKSQQAAGKGTNVLPDASGSATTGAAGSGSSAGSGTSTGASTGKM